LETLFEVPLAVFLNALLESKISRILTIIGVWATVYSLCLVAISSLLWRIESLLLSIGIFAVLGVFWIIPDPSSFIDTWILELRQESVRILDHLVAHPDFSDKITFDDWMTKGDEDRKRILKDKYPRVMQLQVDLQTRNEHLDSSTRSFGQEELLIDNVKVEKSARKARDALDSLISKRPTK
jgi:hypothetical protein